MSLMRTMCMCILVKRRRLQHCIRNKHPILSFRSASVPPVTGGQIVSRVLRYRICHFVCFCYQLYRLYHTQPKIHPAGRLAQLVGRSVWRSRGTGFNSQCLPVLGMGSPTVVNGRGVGSRAAPVAFRRSRSPPVNGTTWTRVEGEK